MRDVCMVTVVVSEARVECASEEPGISTSSADSHVNFRAIFDAPFARIYENTVVGWTNRCAIFEE